MDHHIAIMHSRADDDVAELAFEVSDGRSQFVNSAYVGLDWFKEQAAALATFSRQMHGGLYDLKAGETGPEFAGGAFLARFHFHKPTALYISTFQQSEHVPFKRAEVAAEGRLFLRTEPGALDDFVRALGACIATRAPRPFSGAYRSMAPNQRLKLSGCGGRSKGNASLLIAAAAPRSLIAIG